MYISDVPTGELAVPTDPDSIGLLSMGLIASYDPSQLEVTTGTDRDKSIWWMGPPTDISTPGVVDMKGGRLYPGMYGDDIHLGTIELHCIYQPACSFLTLIDHPYPYDDFVLADGTVLDGTIEYGSIEINNVPIPGAILLLGSGFLGLVGIKRKFRG